MTINGVEALLIAFPGSTVLGVVEAVSNGFYVVDSNARPITWVRTWDEAVATLMTLESAVSL